MNFLLSHVTLGFYCIWQNKTEAEHFILVHVTPYEDWHHANTTAGGLVTSGPYRYIRNPIYTSVVLFSFAGACAHVSWSSVVFALVILAGALARVIAEERFLRIRYPEYAEYAARTKRMVPHVF